MRSSQINSTGRPSSFPEPSNFLRCMLDENEGLWKGPVLIFYCIAFQITNQDHLRIGARRKRRLRERDCGLTFKRSLF